MKSLTACLVILALCCIATPALAGRNAGGALIVHTNDAYAYSGSTACTAPQGEPISCEAAVTRTDKTSGSVVWLLAAFPAGATPSVTVVYFGIEYDDVNLDPGASFRMCGPAGSLEVPDSDWPYIGRGNSVVFGSPISGDVLFPFYVFKIDDYSGGIGNPWFGTTVNPIGGYAAFVDDGNPPQLDTCTQFGHVTWRASGANACPEATLQACCFPGGTCTMALAADCLVQSGLPQGIGSVCEPNPCPLPCCLPPGDCELLPRAECTASGGEIDTTSTTCVPNPCPQPPLGACCFGLFECHILNELDCFALDGGWYAGSDCDPNPCPQEPLGACCSPGGICYPLPRYPCERIGFVWKGPGASCLPNPCSAGSERPTPIDERSWGSIKAMYR